MLFYSLISLCLSLLSLFSRSHGTNGPFHQFCNATSSSVNDCHLYLMESVTFVCPCNQTGCEVLWSVNNATQGQEYNIDNVTYSDEGEITCDNGVHQKYVWNITVSQPTPPHFVKNVTIQPNDVNCPALMSSEDITIGDEDHPTCFPCFNISVTGTPKPIGTWFYYNITTYCYDPVITNESDPSSSYFVEEEGENYKLCFSDLENYERYHHMYKFNAANVGGSISVCFTTNIEERNYPIPGNPSSKHYFEASSDHFVTFEMDRFTNSDEGASFTVCRYNISLPNELISCCFCSSQYSDKCMWGTLNDNSVSSHHICQVNTTYPGKYQFEIYTSTYPCNIKIGDPVFVHTKQDSDSSDLGLILGTSIPGGVVILIVIVSIVGTTTVYCRTRQHNHIVHREYQQITNEPANKPVSRPLIPPATTIDEDSHLLHTKALPPTDTPSSSHTASNTLQHTTTIQDDDTFSNIPALISAPTLQRPTTASGTDSLPLPEQASDHVQGIVPITVPKSTCPPAPLHKKRVYVIHCNDSKQWVDNLLKTVLTTINVQMVTIDDAMVGSSISDARYELVDKADKVIVVISPSSRNKWSKENQWSEFELAHARQKDPDSSKIKIIPVLYGNVKSEDLPATVSSLVSLRFDATDFKEKVKESIFYEPTTSNDILYDKA